DLEAKGLFAGDKGAEVRSETERLIRKLRFAKPPEPPAPSPAGSPSLGGTEDEPNDGMGTANPIACNQATSGAISPAGDVDWFTFQLATTQLVDLVLSCTGDTTIALRDGGGALLAFDDDSGPGLCSRITQQLDAGTYFVEVHEFGDDSTLSYTLS